MNIIMYDEQGNVDTITYPVNEDIQSFFNKKYPKHVNCKIVPIPTYIEAMGFLDIDCNMKLIITLREYVG